ncbi:MAG: hypothetical protein ACK448_00910 [Bacteroidota bacterium]|jgi:hypothetical protein
MKKISITLFTIAAIIALSIAQQSCSSKPEGAFTEEEKGMQDSTDSTAQVSDFEALMQQDSLSKDSNQK